ncbi:hypothetical protein CCO02nite_15290 [Cellulomonas composti]|uniref:Uncharacterized protein n=1 Tax=Cellulomonas composti TaxID=266130 RepID=A0A511JA49_9CELL|nr:hypothetical protein CCO02nite_15290 [Cellulomonas composti]
MGLPDGQIGSKALRRRVVDVVNARPAEWRLAPSHAEPFVWRSLRTALALIRYAPAIRSLAMSAALDRVHRLRSPRLWGTEPALAGRRFQRACQVQRSSVDPLIHARSVTSVNDGPK